MNVTNARDPHRCARFIHQGWIGLVIVSYGLLNYYAFGGWWNSSLGTLLILAFSYLAWGKRFQRIVGLPRDGQTWIKALVLAVVTILGALLIMGRIAGRHDFIIRYSTWKNYYHDVFYTFNEEMILGAIVLFFMINRLRIRPILSSLLLALIFAILHFVFYKWVFLYNGTLSLLTLTSLFLIAVVRNNLIIQTGHIGYSWALHFGWMAVMFGSWHINTIDADKVLSEYDKFNLYLGSVEMLVVSAVLAGVSLFFFTTGTGPDYSY